MVRTVVHFDDSREFGGAEQAALHVLAGLDRRRWRPVLFHHAEPGVAPMVDRARSLGVEVRPVPPVWTRAEARKGFLPFFRALRVERPAVFHAHLTTAVGCKYGLLAAALARVPAVVGTVQLLFEVPPAWRYDVSQRIVTACVDRYIAVSQAIARQMHERFGVPMRKLVVIHNAVLIGDSAHPSAVTRLRAALAGPARRPIVLTLARLEAQKGHTYLLQAAARVPEAQFVIAGDGAERGSLEAQASALGLADRVTFLGFRTDGPELLASCDLFVLPSLFEGLPLALLEAMAVGKPVISSNVPGSNEAVVHLETGLLVPPADPPALADAIQTLLCDAALAARLAMNASRRVRQEFSADEMVERVSALYDEVLTAKKASRGNIPI